MKLTTSIEGNDYTIDVPISELEYDMMTIERYKIHTFNLENPEPIVNAAIFSLALVDDDSARGYGCKKVDSNILEKCWPLKYNAFHSAKRKTSNEFHHSCFMAKVIQKHLDKTAEQVKTELRHEFIEKRKNEEAHINIYTDLYTDVKTFNSVFKKEYEDCQKQIEELTDTVYDFQKNLDKTAEQVKVELRQEFLPKNEDEEAHVTIYNDLYTDIKTMDDIFKKEYEQCQKQIAELIHTLSIHQKKIELLSTPQPIDWFENFVNVINLLAIYVIAFQIIYILYTFPDTNKNPIIQYTRNILQPTRSIFLGYIE